MAKQIANPPGMTAAAREQMRRLDKDTLVDLAWGLTRLHETHSEDENDPHAVLHAIDELLRGIDLRRQQRPKLLAVKFAEVRVQKAQGGAVVTKQVRTRLTPRRKVNP